MKYRYAFASSGWHTVDSDPVGSVGILKGVKPTWQDFPEQSTPVAYKAAKPKYIPISIVRSFLRHPILTILFNGLASLSIVAAILRTFIDFPTLHPLTFLFIALASGSLSFVLSAAVEDFYDEKEEK